MKWMHDYYVYEKGSGDTERVPLPLEPREKRCILTRTTHVSQLNAEDRDTLFLHSIL